MLCQNYQANRRFSRTLPEVETDHGQVLEELQLKLNPQEIPRVIECFDISHVSGTFVVASMVRFVGGKPDKKGIVDSKLKACGK